MFSLAPGGGLGGAEAEILEAVGDKAAPDLPMVDARPVVDDGNVGDADGLGNRGAGAWLGQRQGLGQERRHARQDKRERGGDGECFHGRHLIRAAGGRSPNLAGWPLAGMGGWAGRVRRFMRYFPF